MSAIDTIQRICDCKLVLANCKYCFVDDNKKPFKLNNEFIQTNHPEQFVELDELLTNDRLIDYAGVGISVQASKLCGIDVDKCFSKPFDINSADKRVLDIIDRFKTFAYIEFSFSGKGLRVLFKQKLLQTYKEYIHRYYIKNDAYGIEFYRYDFPSRYLTVTGRVLYDNDIESKIDFTETIETFLNDYMTRPKREKRQMEINTNDGRSIDELSRLIKVHYFKNLSFQNLWFKQAPGSGKDESQTDYAILAYLFENITQDRDKLRLLFETSTYYLSKDRKHIYKWQQQNHRYFEYIYCCLIGER